MPRPYPEKFRQGAVRVSRNRGPRVTVEQVATDFGEERGAAPGRGLSVAGASAGSHRRNRPHPGASTPNSSSPEVTDHLPYQGHAGRTPQDPPSASAGATDE
ncbi:hypothetical protein C4J65_30885 [Streptomyces sp. CB09001]|nr:hypothetical protein C4J65_30885 [Streptomyces sp. CB09001]